MRTVALALVLLCGMFVGCQTPAANGLEEGNFAGGVSSVASLDPKSLALSTDSAAYVSFDAGKTWKGVFATLMNAPGQEIGDCIGGSPQAFYFLVTNRTASFEPLYETLTKWSQKDGVANVYKFPPGISCAFVSDRRGAYSHGRHVYITADGGANWKETEPMPLPADADPNPAREFNARGMPATQGRYQLEWSSPSDLVVVAGDCLAVYDVGATGTASRRWVHNLAEDQGIDRLKAVGNGEIWLAPNSSPGEAIPNIRVFGIRDGARIQRDGDWPAEASYRLQNGEVFVGRNLDQNVSFFGRLQLIGKSARPIASITLPLDFGDLVPDGNGGMLIFLGNGTNNSLYKWDGKAATAVLMHPRIDNSIVRKEYLGPDYVPPAMIADLVIWMLLAGPEASDRISEAADQHTSWGNVQKTKWVIEQCMIAVIQLRNWNPLATQPVTQPAQTKLRR